MLKTIQHVYPASTPNIYLFTENYVGHWHKYWNGNKLQCWKRHATRNTSAAKIRVFVSSHLILYFEYENFNTSVNCLGSGMTKLHTKFGQNWTNGSKVIKVLVKFKMAAGGHLGLRISGSWRRLSLSGEEQMPVIKFGANRMNRSEVIAFLSVFPVSSAAILDFAKWHFWPIRCLGGVKTKLHAKFGENRTNGSKVI